VYTNRTRPTRPDGTNGSPETISTNRPKH